MTKELLVSGSEWMLDRNAVLLKAKKSQSGPETHVVMPLSVLVSLAMHARRAVAAKAAAEMHKKDAAGYYAVTPLPIQTAKVLPTDGRTMGACLLVLDQGTDVELQLSIPTPEFARDLGEALLAAATEAANSPTRAN